MQRHPLVGKQITGYFNNNTYEGTVVRVIEPDTALSIEEMKEYTGLSPGDKCYRSVRGPTRVERIVMQRDNGTYVVSPTHLFLR